MKAVLRGIRITPKKANLIAGMVRGKKVKEALAILKFMPKKGAGIIYKVVNSAAHNAKNNFKQDIDDLFITKIFATQGTTYKRSLPVSRGRSHPILKKTSHITVEVGMIGGTVPVVPKKVEKSEETTGKNKPEKTAKKPAAAKPAGKSRKPVVKKSEAEEKTGTEKEVAKTVAKKTGKKTGKKTK
jgi:large subunit ribosomal protein L22